MEINKEIQVSHFHEHHFEFGDLRVVVFIGFIPYSVEVLSRRITSKIAHLHAVYVHHGYYGKLHLVPQPFSFSWVSTQIPYNTLHHERTHCFSWVLSSLNEHLSLLFGGCIVCYGYKSQTVTQRCRRNILNWIRDLSQQSLHSWEWIWIVHRDIDFI